MLQLRRNLVDRVDGQSLKRHPDLGGNPFVPFSAATQWMISERPLSTRRRVDSVLRRIVRISPQRMGAYPDWEHRIETHPARLRRDGKSPFCGQSTLRLVPRAPPQMATIVNLRAERNVYPTFGSTSIETAASGFAPVL